MSHDSHLQSTCRLSAGAFAAGFSADNGMLLVFGWGWLYTWSLEKLGELSQVSPGSGILVMMSYRRGNWDSESSTTCPRLCNSEQTGWASLNPACPPSQAWLLVIRPCCNISWLLSSPLPHLWTLRKLDKMPLIERHKHHFPHRWATARIGTLFQKRAR